jgi:integrase
VDLEHGELTVRAENAKDKETRILPISARLKAVLETAKTDPAGNRFAPTAYVFGDGIGLRLRSIKTAWDTAVLLSRGVKPEREDNGRLSADCRAELKAANLHFHDLRHEAGSRLLKAGWPPHHVKDMLGHADVKTTDTYLNVTVAGLDESMRKFDQARANLQEFASEAPKDQRFPCKPEPAESAKVSVN